MRAQHILELHKGHVTLLSSQQIVNEHLPRAKHFSGHSLSYNVSHTRNPTRWEFFKCYPSLCPRCPAWCLSYSRPCQMDEFFRHVLPIHPRHGTHSQEGPFPWRENTARKLVLVNDFRSTSCKWTHGPKQWTKLCPFLQKVLQIIKSGYYPLFKKTSWFIHSLNKYFLSTYYMPGTVLSIDNIVMKKRGDDIWAKLWRKGESSTSSWERAF